MTTRTIPAFAVAILLPAAVTAQPVKDKEPATGKVSYCKDVRPIFQQHCQGCHQPAKPQGGFVMTSHPELFKEYYGTVIPPGAGALSSDRETSEAAFFPSSISVRTRCPPFLPISS